MIKMKKFDAIIVADGLFPQRKELLELMKKGESDIIACDGALSNLIIAGIEPDMIVGDMDSLAEEEKYLFAERIIRIEDQETNDLTKAAGYAKSQGYRNICILGATCLREDHTLGNISLLTQYQDMFDSVCIQSDFGLIRAINKTTTFRSMPGQQVSIFFLPSFTKIRSIGLKYPIEDKILPIWWEGTLNEAIGDSFTLELEQEGNRIVDQTHEKKNISK